MSVGTTLVVVAAGMSEVRHSIRRRGARHHAELHGGAGAWAGEGFTFLKALAVTGVTPRPSTKVRAFTVAVASSVTGPETLGLAATGSEPSRV